jgi:hypothetical protein
MAFRYSFYWMKKNEWKSVESALREYRFPYLLESKFLNKSDLGFVEIVIKGDFEKYDKNALKQLKDTLVRLLNITEDKLSVLIMLKGSIKIVFTIPLETISKLKQIANSSADSFVSVGIEFLCFEDETAVIFNDNKAPDIVTTVHEIKPVEISANQKMMDDTRLVGTVSRKELIEELLRMFPRVDRFITTLRFYNISMVNDLCIDSPMQTYMDFIMELEQLSPKNRCELFRVLSLTKPGSVIFKKLFDYFNN